MTDEILQSSEPTPTESAAAQEQEAAGEPIVAIDEVPAPLELLPAAPAEEQNSINEPEPEPEPAESFADMLSAFDREHTHRAATKQLEGTVITLSADQVFLDIGY